MKMYLEDGTPSKEFYLFLKYNKVFEKDKVESLSNHEITMYNEFCRLSKELNQSFEIEDTNKASMIFGTISSMFGFNRHYCSMTGLPISGAYYKIGGKIVSKEAYDSYKIIQEMEKKNTIDNKKKSKNEEKTKK